VNNPLGYVTTETTMAVELYTTLVSFFQMHPQFSQNPFYVFGESYAGKYIPSLTHYILTQNQNNPPLRINLQGLAMGDGWVNPYVQTGSYAPFLYANNLIDYAELEGAAAIYEIYKGLVDSDNYLLADDVGNTLLQSLVEFAGGVDVYDIRYFGGDPTDPLQDALTNYLNTPAIQRAFNAGNSTWQACATSPYFGLLDDIEQSVENLLPDLLANYQVMNYNGNKDLICNMIGTNEWTSQIGWPGQNAYNNAQNQTWTVAGKVAGYYKYAANLTHLIVYNAGHMAPFDQPQNTQSMLYTFISGGFQSKKK
jgi:carboxypeptidase C (cathepsin A)